MPDDQPDKPTGGPGDEANWGRYLAYGMEILVGVGLGVIVGLWLDRKFNSAPWGVIVGSMLGMAGGMYLLIKDALKMNKD